MDHGKIVSRGWEIGWNHKWMYGLGAIAALTSGIQLGGSQGSFDFAGLNATPGEVPEVLENSPFFNAMLQSAETGDPVAIFEALGSMFAILASLLILAFILGIVFWFLGLGGRAGLILSVSRAEDGEKGEFMQNLRDGFGYIMPLFLMKLFLTIGVFVLFGVIFAAFFGIFGATMFAGGEDAIGLIFPLMCGLLCLIFPFMLSLNFVDAYAFRGIVLRDQGVGESLKHGWDVLKSNFSDNFILGLIFAVLSGIVSTLIGLVITPVSLAFANPILEFMMEGAVSSGATVSILFGSLILTALTALLTGILVTWQSASFTLAYREFTGMTPVYIDPLKSEKQPDPNNFDDMGDFI